MPKTYYGFSMENEIWRLFRVILRILEFEYEVSDCDDHTHVEVLCTEQDAIALQATFETMLAGKEAMDAE